MREHFDRSVRYLPDEAKYVVCLRHFRGQIEVEEAAFFVRAFEPATGAIRLSDGSQEPLGAASLRASPIDGAWLCTVKRQLAPRGLPARFSQSAQAALLGCVDARDGRPGLVFGGAFHPLPEALG